MIGLGTHVRLTGEGIGQPWSAGLVGVVLSVDAPVGGYAPRYTIVGPVGAPLTMWSVIVGAGEFEPALHGEVEGELLASARADYDIAMKVAREEAEGRANAEARVWHLETELRRLAEQLRTVARGLPKTMEVLAENAEREAGDVQPPRAVVPA